MINRERKFEETIKFIPKFLQNTDNAGDRRAGLQKLLRNWVAYLLTTEEKWRDHFRFVSNASELSIAASELVNGGIIFLFGDVNSPVSISNDDITIIGVHSPKITDTLTVNAHRFTLKGIYIYKLAQNTDKDFVVVTGNNCTIEDCRAYVTNTTTTQVTINIIKITGNRPYVRFNDFEVYYIGKSGA